MAIWSLRKTNAHIFRAGYTENASSPLWRPIRLPTAFGMILVCLWQNLLAVGTLLAVSAALHLRVGRHFAFWLVVSVAVSLVVLNCAALLADPQWRQLTGRIRGHSETDWTFAGLVLYLCAAGFWALLFWLLPRVIDYSK